MVRGSTLPELNDEFAKQAGPFENLQALREAVLKQTWRPSPRRNMTIIFLPS